MTATQTETETHDDHEVHDDLYYWKIGGILAVITALEVWTYWWPEGTLTSLALILMMTVKFTMVAMFFMHLKGDNKMLSQVFVAGIVIALAVYLGFLSAMVIFDDGGNAPYTDPPPIKEAPEVVVERSAIFG